MRLTLGIAAALVTLGLVVFNLALIANRLDAGAAGSRLDHLVIALYVASIALVPLVVVYRSASRGTQRPVSRSVLLAMLVANLVAAPYLLVALAG